MRHHRLVLFAVIAAACLTAAHADWPHLRGPATDGTVAAPGTFEKEAGLTPRWRVPLGSGYSGVAVVDGRAVTGFADGEFDWIGAFSVRDGSALWRRQLGPRTEGVDGADDGPLSSPVIAKGRVFALATDGRLWAFSLQDGTVAWSRDLAGELSATRPHFGFASTPLVAGDTLVVQIGGAESHSIVGLDPRTGATRWSAGDDGVGYQSPSVMTLGGVEQVVVVGNRWLMGLVPADGRVLWRHDLGEEARTGSAMPVHVGDDRVYVPKGGGATVFSVTKGDGGFEVATLYDTDALGNSYARPVYHDGHLYGFRGQVLTCVDAATGERVWRSRPPGGDGLILVDGRLVIFGAKGRVVIADATPDGYVELAGAEALGGSGLTWPSFSDGLVLVRNLEELAAVAVTASATPELDPDAAGEHGMTSWLRSLDGVDDLAKRREAVDALLARHETLPWVEGEWIHFLYRGDVAEDVSVAGSMLDASTPLPLARVPGTDLYHRSVRVEPGGRWEYRFRVDFDEWVTDPRNPATVAAPEGDGELSEVATEGYDAPDLGEPLADDAPRGRVESFVLSSDVLGYDKTIRVWLPPGYDDGVTTYPLLVVDDGVQWIERGGLVEVLDRLVGRSIAPLVAAFVEPHDAWWTEAGGSNTAKYATMLADELPEALTERYRIAEGPAARTIMDNRYFAAAAVYAALAHPGSYGRVAVHSVYLDLGAGNDIRALVHDGAAPETTFRVDWLRYDERDVDRGYDFARASRRFRDELEHAGYGVEGGEVLDSYGWGGWRNRAVASLLALFPTG